METINGYSINDKARLEAEMANFKHKRNTSLAVGITLFVVAIIAIFVIVGIMMADTMKMAEAAGSSSGASYTYEEIMNKYAGLMVLIYLLAFAATAGEIIAAAGGISNHIKFANRRKTLQRLKEIEPNVEQF